MLDYVRFTSDSRHPRRGRELAKVTQTGHSYSGRECALAGRSSVGRARRSKCRGQGFDSPPLYHPLFSKPTAPVWCRKSGAFPAEQARAFNFIQQREAAIAEASHAVELNPFDPYAKNVLGGLLALGAGRFEEGIPWIEQAVQLSPKDPQLHLNIGNLALASLGAGQYEKAIKHARESLRRRPGYFEAQATLASALGYLGRPQEALVEIEMFKSVVRERVERNALFARVTKDCILDGLRKAGWEG